ncbi:hypothetical protein [Janibacter limosus]|uniref:hypothetical protein n=1 Tax=Janibacter limosus TaxID=53458 RepID=UPI0035DF4526
MPEAADWTDGFHLVVSRLMPYKNVDVVIEAFAGLPERLVVIGAGPLPDQLRTSAPRQCAHRDQPERRPDALGLRARGRARRREP